MLPRNSNRLRGAAVLAAAAVALAAASCTYVNRPPPPPSDTPYQRDARQASLEVPPDLTRSGIRDAYPVPGTEDASGPADTVLPRVEGIRIEREGTLRWLVVEAEPAELWPSLRDFWRRQGFGFDTDDARVGVLETGWAEKRVDLPVGGVRRFLARFKRFAYTYAVRDRFRTRVERSAEPGVTEIHVTHQGAQEEVRGDSYAWTPRPPDPDLETEMLGRLMHFLASGDDSAVDPAAVAAAGDPAEPRARIMDDPGGGKYIRVNEDFDRSWRLIRRGLDRGGFTVVDLDRSAGFFLVRYIDPEAGAGEKRSWLGRLAFWRDRSKKEVPEDTEFRIALERGDGGPPTRVVIHDAKGARDTGESATRILTALAENVE